MSQQTNQKAANRRRSMQRRRPPLRLDGEGHAEPAITHMHHAAVHQLFIQAPIFRPIKKGARDTPLTCWGRHKRNGIDASYEFSGPQLLDIFDQTMFLLLTRRAGIDASVITNTHEQWSQVKSFLGMTGFTVGDQTACILLTPSDLIRDQQRSPDEKGRKAVLASLGRLASTTVMRTLYDESGTAVNGNSYKLIAIVEREDGQLAVLLNPESASRVKQKVGVAWISMQEQAGLKQEAAKRLHAWLSTALPKRDKRCYSLDNVIKHVWGALPSSPAQRKDLKRTLKSALDEVAELPGWHCSFAADGKSIEAYKPIFLGTRARDQQSPTLHPLSATPYPTSPTSKPKTATKLDASAAPVLASGPVVESL